MGASFRSISEEGRTSSAEMAAFGTRVSICSTTGPSSSDVEVEERDEEGEDSREDGEDGNARTAIGAKFRGLSKFFPGKGTELSSSLCALVLATGMFKSHFTGTSKIRLSFGLCKISNRLALSASSIGSVESEAGERFVIRSVIDALFASEWSLRESVLQRGLEGRLLL